MKKPLTTPEDFELGMISLRSAGTMLAAFDWELLMQQVKHFEGAGAIIRPEVFMAMQRDPEWETKKKLFELAFDFVTRYEVISREHFKGRQNES